MERDKLRTNLNRTTEEKEKLVKEGDEHLEHISKISEKRTKYVCMYEVLGILQFHVYLCYHYFYFTKPSIRLF